MSSRLGSTFKAALVLSAALAFAAALAFVAGGDGRCPSPLADSDTNVRGPVSDDVPYRGASEPASLSAIVLAGTAGAVGSYGRRSLRRLHFGARAAAVEI